MGPWHHLTRPLPTALAVLHYRQPLSGLSSPPPASNGLPVPCPGLAIAVLALPRRPHPLRHRPHPGTILASPSPPPSSTGPNHYRPCPSFANTVLAMPQPSWPSPTIVILAAPPPSHPCPYSYHCHPHPYPNPSSRRCPHHRRPHPNLISAVPILTSPFPSSSWPCHQHPVLPPRLPFQLSPPPSPLTSSRLRYRQPGQFRSQHHRPLFWAIHLPLPVLSWLYHCWISYPCPPHHRPHCLATVTDKRYGGRSQHIFFKFTIGNWRLMVLFL